MRRKVYAVLEGLSAGLVVAGVSAWSLPLAAVVAGVAGVVAIELRA